MKANIIFVMIGLVSIAGGCGPSVAPSAAKAEIVSSLESRNRATTHVVLWTLEQNGFSVPQIDFEKPYHVAAPQLQQLSEELADLPPSKLSELDESLKYHWSIYSPIWFEGGDGWER